MGYSAKRAEQSVPSDEAFDEEETVPWHLEVEHAANLWEAGHAFLRSPVGKGHGFTKRGLDA